MTVVSFRGRSLHRSSGCTNRSPAGDRSYYERCCAYCEWGAFICVHCGAAEGEVPTDCPRRPMTEEECAGVLGGRLDYIVAAGGWVIETSTRSRYECLPADGAGK